MGQWTTVVPKSKGAYFYRAEKGMPSAIVERTAEGFLFHGVERVVDAAPLQAAHAGTVTILSGTTEKNARAGTWSRVVASTPHG